MQSPWELLRNRSVRLGLLGLGVLLTACVGAGLYFALARGSTPVQPTPQPPEDEMAVLTRLDANAPVSAKERRTLGDRWLALADQRRGNDQLYAFRRAYHWYRLALWQLGDGNPKALEEGMARAASVIEPADAAANRFTLYEGNWRTAYGAVTRDYYVRGDGLVLIRAASDGRAGWQGKASRKDGAVLFNWEKGTALDKPAQRGNRWQLERFVAADFPKKVLARGTAAYLGPEAPASFAPHELVVCGRRDIHTRLFRTDLEGNLQEYADQPANSLCPAWSPDGTKILFGSTRDGGRRHLFVMDADGKNVKQLTSGDAECRCPAWSPDGRKIAFAKHVGLNAQVFVMDADGSNPKSLSNDGAFAADPAWSPDGRRIAFASNRSIGGFRLYVMDADGGNQRELTPEGNVIGSVYPAWAPDGQTIAFSGPYQGGLALFTIDPDGKDQRRLTDLPGRNTFATWSPDGAALAFAHFGQTHSIYVVNPRGGPVSLTPIVCDLVNDDGRIAWRPRPTPTSNK